MLHFTFILGICVIATFAPLLAASTIGTDSVEAFVFFYRQQVNAVNQFRDAYSADRLLKSGKTVHTVAFSNDGDLRDPENGQILGFTRRAALVQTVLDTINNGYPIPSRLSNDPNSNPMRFYCEDYPLACGAVTPPSLYKRIKKTNKVLDELYPRLIERYTEAKTKLDGNEVLANDTEICAPEDADRILCELEAFQAMLANKYENVTRIRECLQDVASVERGIIREVGTLYTVTRIVGTWMVQLLSAYGLCNCRMDRTDEIVSMARSIRDAFSDPSLPEDDVPWTHPSLKVANYVMASLTEFRWPQSSADSVKYNAVAESLNKGLKEVWGDDSYKSFAFYGGNSADSALVGNLAPNKREEYYYIVTPWLRHPVHFIRNTSVSVGVWRRSSVCNDSTREEAFSEIKNRIAGAMKYGSLEHDAPTSARHLEAYFRPATRSHGACFPSAIVVQCVYKFVWYELAWTYFHATSHNSYFIDSFTGSYKPCIRIALLP